MTERPSWTGAVGASLLTLLAVCLVPGHAAAQPGERRAGANRAELVSNLSLRRGGPLALMGYNATPDGSANVLQVDRNSGGGAEGSPTLYLSQVGFGFTVSESFPLFLEIYGGYARYDPRALFTNLGERRAPLRWNNVTATLGVGYDIRLAENLYLRPILNGALGYAASDAALFGALVGWRTGRDTSILTDRHMNAYGLGGSLTLAYYDYRPARDIDFELRYTQINLQTFGDTFPAARGSSTARTVGAWGRVRWPTGWEAFGRPIRWVVDANATLYLGDQREAVGFDWAVKVGGGIEFDIGRHEIGAFGLNLTRVRLVGRVLYGDNNVTGGTFGLGVSF